MGRQDTDLKLRLSQGAKDRVRDVKGEVGISIPNAPPTGNSKADKGTQIRAATPGPPSRAVRVSRLMTNNVFTKPTRHTCSTTPAETHSLPSGEGGELLQP